MKCLLTLLFASGWLCSGLCQWTDSLGFATPVLHNEKRLLALANSTSPNAAFFSPKTLSFLHPSQPLMVQDSFPFILGKYPRKLTYDGKRLSHKNFPDTLSKYRLARKEFDKAKPYRIMIWIAAAASAGYSLNQIIKDAHCADRIKKGDLYCDTGGIGELTTFGAFTFGVGVAGSIRFKRQVKKSIKTFNKLQMQQREYELLQRQEKN